MGGPKPLCPRLNPPLPSLTRTCSGDWRSDPALGKMSIFEKCLPFQEGSFPVPAMDSLTVAMKNNIVPNQEYLLQGSVLDSAVEVLLHRLRGLCDNVDSGPETFHDHEMCFSISNANYLLIQRYRDFYLILLLLTGSGTPQPLTLRVRRAIDFLDMPYQLRYIGQPELGKTG